MKEYARRKEYSRRLPPGVVGSQLGLGVHIHEEYYEALEERYKAERAQVLENEERLKRIEEKVDQLLRMME